MKTHTNTAITTLLIVLNMCGALWAQAIVEDQAETNGQGQMEDDAIPFVLEGVPEPGGSIELMADLPEGRVISYDTFTGEEAILDTDIDLEDMPQEQWIPGSKLGPPEALDAPFDLMNFSDLTWISNPEDYPWSPICKINYSRYGVRYTGSGILIDPYHVLCAGHIVNEGNGGIWSSDVVVMPGYDGGICPFGDAKGIHFRSWEGWTLFGNLKHNIGVIRLDRPIGALTKCYGYGWTRDMSFYERAQFRNPGYPAEGSYTGQYMYYRSGTFDGMDYPLLIVNRRGFGGVDGSGAYWIDPAGHRYVFAVLSCHNDSQTFFAMITENKFRHIQDYIDDFTPLKFDLISLAVKASPGTVRAGNRLNSMSYVVYNHSSSSWLGTVGVDVYLSTNDFISTSDILIDRHYFMCSLGPKEKVTITVSNPPRIPWYLFGGNYWLGVMLDISDHDTSNNFSQKQDAAHIDAL